MIISNTYNKIFPRIPKTGSSTMTEAIRDYVNLDMTDKTTPMSNKKAKAMGIDFNGVSAHNTKLADDQFNRSPENNMRVAGESVRRTGITFTHMTPEKALQYNILTQDDIMNKTIHCFIRHPFTRYMSAWKHTANNMLTRHKIMLTQEDFELSIINGKFSAMQIFNAPQSDWTHIAGQLVAKLSLFEDFDNEMRIILNDMGVDPNKTIMHRNNTSAQWNRLLINHSPNSGTYHLTPETEEILTQKYNADLYMWNTLAAEKNYNPI